MIQFNLLPDIKLEYLKTKKLKHMIITISFISAVAAIVIMLMTLAYSLSQSKHLSDLDADVDALVTELNNEPDLTKILSIQNQLNSLPAIYDARPEISRLPDILKKTTPDVNKFSISSLTMDMATNQMTVSGGAPSLDRVYDYIDTLKFSSYKENVDGAAIVDAFKDEKLDGFSNAEEETTFTVSFTFDPTLFNTTKDIQFFVATSNEGGQ